MANIKSFPNNQDEYIGAEYVMRWLHGRTSGVFGADNNANVSAVQGAMAVTVSDGTGWMSNSNSDGVVWWNDNEAANGSKLQLSVDSADSTLNRIDRVIVEWKTTNYVDYPEIKILKGTTSSIASAPSLTNNSTVRQISLARISIPAGTISITPALITDERLDTSVCGIVTETVKVDTSVLYSQFQQLLTQIQNNLYQILAGQIANGAVTREKLASDVKVLSFTGKTVAVSGWASDSTYTDFPYRAAVACDGVTAKHYAEVTFSPADALEGIFCPVVTSYDGGVYIYASEIPGAGLTIPTIVCTPVE